MSHTIYRIHVERAGEKWEVERRFSSFRELRVALAGALRDAPSLDLFRLSDGLMPEVVSARRLRLQAFLDVLCSSAAALASESAVRFLALSPHAHAMGGGARGARSDALTAQSVSARHGCGTGGVFERVGARVKERL